MKRTIIMAGLIFTVSIVAAAHGTDQHIMGKVTNISKNNITVKTTTGQTVTVVVSDETMFEQSGSPAKLTDLKIGNKVVIHAGKEGGRLIAHHVRFAPATTTTEGQQ